MPKCYKAIGLLLVLLLSATPGQAQNPPLPPADPTKLTTEQLFREIGTMKEIFGAKHDALLKVVEGFDANLKSAITDRNLRMVDADRLQAEINKGNTLRIEQQFSGIMLQFKERDTRTELLAAALKSALEQAAVSTKIAVDAALQAQEKAFATQSLNFTNSLTEVKAGFGKLLDAQQAQITSVKDDSTRAVNSLKDDSTKAIASVKDSVTTIDGKASGMNTSWMVLIGLGAMAIGAAGLAVGGRNRQYRQEEIVAHNPGTTTIRPGRG